MDSRQALTWTLARRKMRQPEIAVECISLNHHGEIIMFKQHTKSIRRVVSASCSLLCILMALCGQTRAQSTDPANPTPITSSTVSGQAKSGGATYYYRFNAQQGSVKITLTGQTDNYSTQFEADVVNMAGTDLGDIYVSASDTAQSSSQNFSFDSAQPVNIVVKLSKDKSLAWQKYIITLSGAVSFGNSGGGNKGNSSASLPDLKVIDVQIGGNGGNKATVIISNECNGDVPASSSIRIKMAIYKDADKKSGVDYYLYGNLAPIAANTNSKSIFVLSSSDKVKSFNGRYLRVDVDPDNTIKEVVESNNWWETGAAPFPERSGYCTSKPQ
jgi:hypothetical protein